MSLHTATEQKTHVCPMKPPPEETPSILQLCLCVCVCVCVCVFACFATASVQICLKLSAVKKNY